MKSNAVDIIKASLGWGIFILLALFGYAIIRGEVTESNSFGLAGVLTILASMATAYGLHYFGPRVGGGGDSQPEAQKNGEKGK